MEHYPPSSVRVTEDDTAVGFTLMRSQGYGSQTVYVSTVQDRGFTNSGDYDGLVNVPVTFGPGETQKTVTVRIREDSVNETDESFSLIVQASPSDPTSTWLARAGFTIADDDDAAPQGPLVLIDVGGRSFLLEGLADQSGRYTNVRAYDLSYNPTYAPDDVRAAALAIFRYYPRITKTISEWRQSVQDLIDDLNKVSDLKLIRDILSSGISLFSSSALSYLTTGSATVPAQFAQLLYDNTQTF